MNKLYHVFSLVIIYFNILTLMVYVFYSWIFHSVEIIRISVRRRIARARTLCINLILNLSMRIRLLVYACISMPLKVLCKFLNVSMGYWCDHFNTPLQAYITRIKLFNFEYGQSVNPWHSFCVLCTLHH